MGHAAIGCCDCSEFPTSGKQVGHASDHDKSRWRSHALCKLRCLRRLRQWYLRSKYCCEHCPCEYLCVLHSLRREYLRLERRLRVSLSVLYSLRHRQRRSDRAKTVVPQCVTCPSMYTYMGERPDVCRATIIQHMKPA